MAQTEKSKQKEALVLAAISNGAKSRQAVAAMTGLSYNVLGTCLRDLFAEYHVKNFEHLTQALAQPESKPEPPPKRIGRFTSHDCVIVDISLPPVTAASLLTQVLGKEYCSRLIDELMIACVPGAPGEGM
jgi:hypothetical protein